MENNTEQKWPQQTMNVKGKNRVELVNYRVTPKGRETVVFPSVILHLGGIEHEMPKYVLYAAAANLWITIQRKMRPLTNEAIMESVQGEIPCHDLSQVFESRRAGKDPSVTLVGLIESGKLTKEQAIELLMKMDD